MILQQQRGVVALLPPDVFAPMLQNTLNRSHTHTHTHTHPHTRLKRKCIYILDLTSISGDANIAEPQWTKKKRGADMILVKRTSRGNQSTLPLFKLDGLFALLSEKDSETPIFHQLLVRCDTAPVRFCSAMRHLATPTGCILRPPWCSSVDNLHCDHSCVL